MSRLIKTNRRTVEIHCARGRHYSFLGLVNSRVPCASPFLVVGSFSFVDWQVEMNSASLLRDLSSCIRHPSRLSQLSVSTEVKRSNIIALSSSPSFVLTLLRVSHSHLPARRRRCHPTLVAPPPLCLDTSLAFLLSRRRVSSSLDPDHRIPSLTLSLNRGCQPISQSKFLVPIHPRFNPSNIGRPTHHRLPHRPSLSFIARSSFGVDHNGSRRRLKHITIASSVPNRVAALRFAACPGLRRGRVRRPLKAASPAMVSTVHLRPTTTITRRQDALLVN